MFRKEGQEAVGVEVRVERCMSKERVMPGQCELSTRQLGANP